MADKVGDEFEGYVTGVAAFGLFIELIEHFVEGMVHVSTMADDYYRFVESAHLLRGENTQKVYRLGDKVKVQVIRVNMDVRQIDLGLVEILERVREGERGPRRSKARAEARDSEAQAAPGPRRAAERKRPPMAEQRMPMRVDMPKSDEIDRRRHRRAHRSRQERAGAGADRHRSRPAEGREGARHHHRPRVRARRRSTASTSRSSTCPGHERFVKNMLAGVGGIDLVVLVVAADESVMPQTREHFDICRLLRVPAGLVALTKSDLVDADTLELARLEVARAGRRLVPRGRADRAGVGADRRRARRASRGARRRSSRAAAAARVDGVDAAADRSRVLDEGLRHRRHRHAGVGPHRASTTSWSSRRATGA